jgi:hypothetical protein
LTSPIAQTRVANDHHRPRCIDTAIWPTTATDRQHRDVSRCTPLQQLLPEVARGWSHWQASTNQCTAARYHAGEIALLTSFCSSGGSFLVAMPSFPANDFHMSDLTPTVPRFISSTTQQHACMVTSASRQAGSSPFGIGRPDQRHRNLIRAWRKYLATAMCL